MLKCKYNLQNFTDRRESFNDLLLDTSMTVKHKWTNSSLFLFLDTKHVVALLVRMLNCASSQATL